MKKLLNQRGYLSWTQIDMWHRSPQRYIEKYIKGGGREITNSGMEYGKVTSTALETGDYGDDELLKAVGSILPRYDSPEHELKVEMDTNHGKVTLLGKLDSFDTKTKSFREYKTGRVKWTQEKANKHKQLHHYASLIWMLYGKMPPEIHLDWIETEEVDGEVRFTGKILSFPVKLRLGDVIEYMAIATKAAHQIDAEYRKYLKTLT